MTETMDNPFSITKAVDFNDEQIHSYWVEMPGGGNAFREIMKPTSPMPILLLGGKGSGKTHLMRHFSFPLQQIRHGSNVLEGIETDGYLGIYFRCSGLNSHRFIGKNQEMEKWLTIFSYYLELWISQLLLKILQDIARGSPSVAKQEERICARVLGIFDSVPKKSVATLNQLTELISAEQKTVDRAVNNAVFTKQLEVAISITPGNLIFGLPQVLSECIDQFENVQFLYLIDELENLKEYQQKYLNTLIREKQLPASFRIGSRLYGVKTLETLSGEEQNKEGSEFEIVRLDNLLRNSRHYAEFSKNMVIRRLQESGQLSSSFASEDLSVFFEMESANKLEGEDTSFVSANYPGGEPPYVKSLREKLERELARRSARDLSSSEDISKVISWIRSPEYPLIEKASILLFYRAWSKGEDLQKSAATIRESSAEYIRSQPLKSDHRKILQYFRSDLLAQLRRECRQPQRYLGIDKLIKMSEGLPKNLLVILKHIYKWSIFNGERPFVIGQKISIRSQVCGVRDASQWFLDDAQAPGEDGLAVAKAIGNLAELLREIRYSDKPSECSLCAFSTDISRCSEKSRLIIDLATKLSLLTEISHGQKNRNSMRIDSKHEMNSLVAPRWDLPVFSRGAIALDRHEVNAIFDDGHSSEFEALKLKRMERMNAPFGRTKERKRNGGHLDLPGIDG